MQWDRLRNFRRPYFASGFTDGIVFAPDGTLYVTVVGPKKADENAPKDGKLQKIAPGL